MFDTSSELNTTFVGLSAISKTSNILKSAIKPFCRTDIAKGKSYRKFGITSEVSVADCKTEVDDISVGSF